MRLSSTVGVHTRWNHQFVAMLLACSAPPLHPPPYSQQRRVGDPNVFTNHAGDTSGFGQWAVNPSNGQWAARPTSSTPIHSHQVNALSLSAGLYLCARLCLCSTFKPRVPAYCLYCISSVSTLLCASACILLLSTCALLLSICLSHTHLPRGWAGHAWLRGLYGSGTGDQSDVLICEFHANVSPSGGQPHLQLWECYAKVLATYGANPGDISVAHNGLVSCKYIASNHQFNGFQIILNLRICAGYADAQGRCLSDDIARQDSVNELWNFQSSKPKIKAESWISEVFFQWIGWKKKYELPLWALETTSWNATPSGLLAVLGHAAFSSMVRHVGVKLNGLAYAHRCAFVMLFTSLYFIFRRHTHTHMRADVRIYWYHVRVRNFMREKERKRRCVRSNKYATRLFLSLSPSLPFSREF